MALKRNSVPLKTVTIRKKQHMKIACASAFVLFTLFAAHSARAADWEIVASPNAGRQANSLSSVAAVAGLLFAYPLKRAGL